MSLPKKSISFLSQFKIQTPEAYLYISVNKTAKQVCKFLEDNKVSKESIDYVVDNIVLDPNCNNQGFYLRTPKGLRFLFIDSYRGTWEDLDVLSHELFHVVDFEAQYRMFEKEPEFKAYLHGALFQDIRIILRKEVDKQINKEKNIACKAKGKKKKK